jgi:hypothetical protein
MTAPNPGISAKGRFVYDDREYQKLMRLYEPRRLDQVVTAAARAGAKAAEPIIRAAAPVGRSRRPSQFYRREGLLHGNFRASVKARKIRRRGIQAKTVGYVIGPAGRAGFTRYWIAGGTRPHDIPRGRAGKVRHPGQKPDPWFDRVLGPAVVAANTRSSAVLTRYAERGS